MHTWITQRMKEAIIQRITTGEYTYPSRGLSIRAENHYSKTKTQAQQDAIVNGVLKWIKQQKKSF